MFGNSTTHVAGGLPLCKGPEFWASACKQQGALEGASSGRDKTSLSPPEMTL